MTQSRALNRLTVCFLILVSISTTKARLSIGPTSPYCTRLTESLDCNFEGIDKPVILDSFGGGMEKEINEIFIRNVNQLTVTATSCFKLHLNSVSKAIFSRPHACRQDQQLSLRLTNSYVNMIPKFITRLDMESSSADEFISEMSFQSLTITGSRIGTLNIAQPFASNAVVKIEHSEIKSLEKLIVENRAQLMIFNTTISQLQRKSLEVNDATATIWITIIKRTEHEAVSVGTNGVVVLEGIDGKVTVHGSGESAGGDPTERRPPQVPNIRRPKKYETPNYFWIIPTVLAIVEGIIIMINCTNWFPALKNIPKKRGIEDGGRPFVRPSYYGQDGQSAVYYSSEGYDISLINKRQKAGKDF